LLSIKKYAVQIPPEEIIPPIKISPEKNSPPLEKIPQ
jgi:hypothetical protein